MKILNTDYADIHGCSDYYGGISQRFITKIFNPGQRCQVPKSTKAIKKFNLF